MPPSPPPSPFALAFPDRPSLRKRTHAAIAHDPSLTGLFTDIATYIHSLRSAGSIPADDDDRTAKKRKLAPQELVVHPGGNGTAASRNGDGDRDGDGNRADGIKGAWEGGSCYSVKDVSFSVPQRKKFVLEVGRKGAGRGIRARNTGTGGVEFGVLWRDIQYALCLPLPEKAQMQYNFVVFPAHDGEPIVWTVPEGPPKPGVLGEGVGVRDETYREMLVRWIGEGCGREVIEPGKGGVGAKGQGWVKGFRGSKDGYLFFLPTGLLWAFKKPLFFFPFAVIDSVSYTSVLQRTFNLNVTVNLSSPTSTNPPSQDFEFSMLDQSDFASIDAYIRTHNLHDASMAEQRRAKKLNINGAKGAGANVDGAGAEGDDGVGELERAAREAQELEDEEEEEGDENFDPGSEGESEGSGSSGEDDGGGGDEGGDGDESEDLVRDELGSEAEEVDMDGEE